MTTRHEFPYRVREVLNLAIPLTDGTRLAARLWLPEDAETNPVPAIVEYIPYRQSDGTAALDALSHPYFAGHGYAALRIDIRGSGNSEGVLHDEYLELEQDDALEVLAWLADQPWCTGAVGMIGISWGGFAALQVAARRPPELKAIVTVCSTDDRYADDVHWMGGCFLTDNIGWGAGIFGVISRPPDRDAVGEAWREMWLARIAANEVPLISWLGHQRRDDFWRHGSVCEDYGAIECAVYAVGGWTDGYTNAIFRLMEHLSAPKQALVGPWTHLYPHFGRPGPAIGFLQDCLQFWDRWLKGEEGGANPPPIRLWMQEAFQADAQDPQVDGRWLGMQAWPGAPPDDLELALNVGRLDQAAEPEQRIGIRSPLACGLAGGTWCPLDGGGDAPEFQSDQREDDGRSLCFDTAPLTEAVEILGIPRLSIDLAVDQPQAMVAVRLCDVAPDGFSSRISFALFNLCHRDGHAEPRALTPGARMTIELPLKIVAYRFRPGHRIRLALSTVYWPMAWPSARPVTLSVFTGASTLKLPLCRADQVTELGDAFEPVETAAPLAVEQIAPGRTQRSITHDVANGTITVVHEDASAVERLEGIDLVTRKKSRDVFTITEGDPLSARVETLREVEYRRGDWRVRTDERMTVTCDLDSFRVVASLTAFEGDELICERSWDERIPRDHV